MWDGKELIEAISGAHILISNDYELQMIMNLTELNKQELLARVDSIITTKGEDGSVITTAGTEVSVSAVTAGQTPADPTGAGDAYRGGLIKGLAAGKGIEESAALGTVCASFAIECKGTQTYTFTSEEFRVRLEKHFN